MITTLELSNFRRFSSHTLELRPTTVIVGANNAGKSTIVEALRLVAIVASRYRSLQFREPPDWMDPTVAAPGVSPSLAGTGIELAGVTHQYRDPPAAVKGTFAGGETIAVYLGPDADVHAILRSAGGALVGSRAQAHRAKIPEIATEPQVAPVVRDERLLAPETVRRNLSSTLAPTHFRNQLYLFDEFFELFRATAAMTWPGFAIHELLREGGSAEEPEILLRLLVRDGGFVGEVARMGHGLQMWLQTIWFLIRNENATTVILDEPDVYMHPDLQHRLVRFLKGRHPQLIIATHSADVMSEVDPGNVLVVNATQVRSRFADSAEGVQRAINRMGGIHNLQLARLASAEKCLLVEGQDLDFLRRFQDRIFPTSTGPLNTLPNMSIGGWSGWPYAVGSSMFLSNAAGQRVRVYCLLDSDYYPPETIAERLSEAQATGVDLHVWQRKEIENYLIVPSLVHRVIEQRCARRTTPPTLGEVTTKIDDVAESFRDMVIDNVANEYLARDRRGGLQAANRAARKFVEPIWTTIDGRLQRGPGKAMLSRLCQWSQEEFGVSFGAVTLASEITPDEIDAEVVSVLTAIETTKALI